MFACLFAPKKNYISINVICNSFYDRYRYEKYSLLQFARREMENASTNLRVFVFWGHSLHLYNRVWCCFTELLAKNPHFFDDSSRVWCSNLRQCNTLLVSDLGFKSYCAFMFMFVFGFTYIFLPMF